MKPSTIDLDEHLVVGIDEVETPLCLGVRLDDTCVSGSSTPPFRITPKNSFSRTVSGIGKLIASSTQHLFQCQDAGTSRPPEFVQASLNPSKFDKSSIQTIVENPFENVPLEHSR